MHRLFNDNWQFSKQALDINTEEILSGELPWEPVAVPHDWLISNTENLYENSTGCYRKTFEINESNGKRFYLRFDGVYMDTSVYINGEFAGEWKYGYTSFEFDITRLARTGTNTVIVICRYAAPNTRWYSGAGIFRDVWLIEKPGLHLVSDGIYAHCEKTGNEWQLGIDTEVLFEPATVADTVPAAAVIRHKLYDHGGTEVAAHQSEISVRPSEGDDPIDSRTPAYGKTVNHQHLSVHSPQIWDLEDPYLYLLQTELLVAGVVVDSSSRRIGFRETAFDPDKGFFLNGRHVKLHGACMHHDHGALGSAFNKTAQTRQFKSLKAMGVNSIRTSHNPPASGFMDLADETGMLIVSEIFDMWEEPKTKYDYARFFSECHEADVAAWVRRDRNRPSIIMWSIGNEIHDTHTSRGLEITGMLRDLVLVHDPFRNGAITIGSNYIAWEPAQACSDQLDVSGYNYAEHLYEEHHRKYPHWVIYGSETASTLQSRGVYHFPASNRLLTHDDLQCSSLDNCTTNWGAKNTEQVIIDDRDAEFCAGQYIWTGWDYIGEPTPYTTKNSYFGQVDTAGFEKDAYYIYQSAWTDCKTAPMVHIAPYWDFNPGQLIDIRVYSNAPKIELFFNDVSMGAAEIDHARGQALSGRYQRAYEPGILKAVAYDEEGNIIAEHVRSSFSDAVKLVLSPDKHECAVDGEDLIYLTVSAVDADGHPVENARNRVAISVEGAGRLVGLDNGDSTDYDQYKGTNRRLFNGKLAAIIAAGDSIGEIRVIASSPGLPDEKLTLKAVGGPLPAGAVSHRPNLTSGENNENCVRKIELNVDGSAQLTPDQPEVTVTAKVYPADATWTELDWKALQLSGVECHYIKIRAENNKAVIKAVGDGEFRLRCSSTNGRPQPEVISELEFSAEGFGSAVLDPYEGIAGSQYAHADGNGIKLSFLGGVFIPGNGMRVSYDNIDFGGFGSKEVTLPIFSFLPVTPLELWEGVPGDGELLLSVEYTSEFRYNTYQPRTFSLKKRIKGVRTISFVSRCDDRISLKELRFAREEKAFAQIDALEYSRISGDSYILEEAAITGIGNNVAVEFEDMDFGDAGFAGLTICGRSHAAQNSIHVRFQNEEHDIVRMVEFSHSREYAERTFSPESVSGKYKVTFMFMPGSNFDMKWFRFLKPSA